MNKPHNKINICWTPKFAYAVGLLVTDGNLSSDGRHISFASKDREQIANFAACLGLQNKVGIKISGIGRRSSHIQFGDVNFYKFLLNIGLMPNKSKIIGAVDIPNRYFFDFLRGHLDGDGSFYSYWDSRWRSSYMFYTSFVSASRKHIEWVRRSIEARLKINGHVTKSVNDSVYQLKYAKADSLKLLPNMYYDTEVICLSRKRDKINKALGLVRRA